MTGRRKNGNGSAYVTNAQLRDYVGNRLTRLEVAVGLLVANALSGSNGGPTLHDAAVAGARVVDALVDRLI